MIEKRPERNNALLAEASPAPLLLPMAPVHKALPALTTDALWSGPRAPGASTLENNRERCPRYTQGKRPTSLVSELSNSRTLGATSLHPSLSWSSSQCARAPHLGEPLQPWVSQPDQCLVLSTQSPESPRGGAGWPSFSILQTAARAPTGSPLPCWGYRLMKRSFSSVICFVFLQSSDK